MRDKYRHSEYERIIRIIVEHRNKRVIHSLVIVIQNIQLILGMHITDSTILRGSTLVHSAHSHTHMTKHAEHTFYTFITARSRTACADVIFTFLLAFLSTSSLQQSLFTCECNRV